MHSLKMCNFLKKYLGNFLKLSRAWYMFDARFKRCKFESRCWSQHTTVGVIDPLRPRSQCFEVERKRTRPQISPFIWSKKTSAASWHKKQFLNSFSKIFCFPNKSFWKWIFRIKICEILYFGFVLKKFVWLLPKYLVILANHKKQLWEALITSKARMSSILKF